MKDQPTLQTRTGYEVLVPTRGELMRKLEKTVKPPSKKSPARKSRTTK